MSLEITDDKSDSQTKSLCIKNSILTNEVDNQAMSFLGELSKLDESTLFNLNELDNSGTNSFPCFGDKQWNHNHDDNKKTSSPSKEKKKIQCLENEIHFLKEELIKMKTGRKEIREGQPKVLINDINPEWDYVNGGNKMIICCSFEPKIYPEDVDSIKICFGDKSVKGTMIQENVLKCYIPESNFEGKVELNLFINEDCLTYTDSTFFEYKKKQKQLRTPYSMMQTDDIVDELFKIRLVEKIRDIGDFGYLNNSNSSFSFMESNFFDQESQNFDDVKLCSFLKKIYRELGKSKVLPELESEDKYGFSLIHYLAKHNLKHSFMFLASIGIPLDCQGKGGISPMHICLCEKNDEILDIILRRRGQDPGKTNQPETLDQLEERDIDIEVLLRKLSFNLSMSNSNIELQNSGSVECSETETETFGILLKMLAEGECHEIDVARITERKQFLNRKRKVKQRGLKNLNIAKILKGRDKDRLMERLMDAKDGDQKIKLIQKNVKCWINRRHYLDVKYAVKVLEEYFEEWFSKKKLI